MCFWVFKLSNKLLEPDIQVSLQRLKGIIAQNPLKETKESLIPIARRELRGTGKFTKNISKVKLGRAMVEA